jgi:cell wall-associated NlpC family hydrolase
MVISAARACIGTPFRPQGRTPLLGLDCVGLVLVAAAAVGLRPQIPPYRLGGDHEMLAEQAILANGCRALDEALPGDIVLLAPHLRLRHFGILSPVGLLHAHAGLGRVVEAPVDAAWQRVGAWRLPGME